MQMQHRAAACSNAFPSSPNFEDEYSWIGDDYPAYLPLDLGGPIALVLEDSRHYPLNSSDADAEWESVYPGGGLGFVRLGPRKRFFSLSLYHQVHCLDSLRHTILGGAHAHGGGEGAHARRDVEHSAHCLNYLRQTIMCNADLTLEPEVVEGSQDVGEGLAAVHVCRDWSKVHDFVLRNWDDWEKWKEQQE
ncbi:hypothetical protein PHLGIDRAFT_246034 [Phlebiopsis gigantea 11061_1 CR5-6]|uniref:Uncharacterized protein n=1 Tax=Phlebiopsis gigantea (strain 11061_1 CR5-6) TaxID=745531 RepID=A0A0C3S533_PHLG1|nr:hypothetical protein PHLGIDRAFT_246034 [Phlebiopsis gigantea 11061_1 CR5-6]